ncbi:MAG: MFS transporter [Bacteroidota bacterium]|nr:MFS transporter [Bacteroidota bacterium]
MNINLFRAFRSRNYRLYFSGQSVSLIGTWMQRTAVYWLIYTQTHSTFMLGLAAFASQFPSFLFSPWGGVVSDRYNRYRVTIITQIASMIQAFLLAALVIFTRYNVWEILTLSIMLGIINAFDTPARQSMVNEMVKKKEDLPNAIALNSSMGKFAWLIGPAISGIVLEKLGAGTCFLINGLSYMAVIVSLLLIKFPPYIAHAHSKRAMKEFKEGFVYLKNTPSIGIIVLLLGCVSLLVLPFRTLLPVYAKVIFKGNASTFGYLNSSIGFGALIGAIFLASLKPDINLKKILAVNLSIFGVALALFSHITNLPTALFFAMIAGFAIMSQTTIANTIIQTSASAEMRGRVISFFAMAFFGMEPLGGLLIGTVSQYIGTPDTILIQGIASILIAIIFLPYLRKDAFN